jgi:integrase
MPKQRRRARRGTGSHRVWRGRHQIRCVIAGRVRAFSADTLAEAQALADAAVREAEAPTVIASPTIRDWLAEWLTRKRASVRPQTYFAYEAHARLHIVPAIGNVRLDALAASHIDRLHAALARKVSGTTAHHVHMTLKAALNGAAKRGHRVSPALAAVDPPRRRARDIETLTRAEVDDLLEAAYGDPLEGLYVLAVTLGMREGELLGLRWQNVDLRARRLLVARNATRALDGSRVLTDPKTAAGKRTLYLPRIALDALARTPHVGELIWPGPDGHPMPEQTLYSRRWIPMRKRAQIRPVSFHALRHTAATLALEDGQPPHVVAAMLGHASVATTLRLYAHVTHASTEALVDAIDARFGPRLRVLPEAVLDQYWTRKVEIGATAMESECRERESNPYALTSTAP